MNLTDLIKTSRALLERGTPGEFVLDVFRSLPAKPSAIFALDSERKPTFVFQISDYRTPDQAMADGRLIVHAVNSLPQLLDTVEELLKENERLKQAIHDNADAEPWAVDVLKL